MSQTLEIFYTGKHFKIPPYQRDYAWDEDNIDDLLEDIIESIETNTTHYIGTFILSKNDGRKIYSVVDGQQRLTSLTMLLNIAINKLANRLERDIYRDKFIRSIDGKWKLELLGNNSRFFMNLLLGKKVKVETKSHQLLLDSYEQIKSRVDLIKQDKELSTQFLYAIKNLEVMEFIEDNEGKAIRIFQTVNDRGKPLSNVDKAKSLLIYYSNRFLDGELDNHINIRFGKIFQSFNEVKTISEEYEIDEISRKGFTEDSVMRYHFLAFADDKFNYHVSEDYVLNIYLKHTLKEIKDSGELSKLKKFIIEYVDDLNQFFENFSTLLRRVKRRKKYFKLFSVLGLSATIYPLLIRLQTRDLLDMKIKKVRRLTFLDLIEIADVRIYKIRKTNPERDIHYIARDSKRIDPTDIESRLFSFITNFMNDSEFISRLNGNIFPNDALRYIFIEYDENLGKKYSLKELLDININSRRNPQFPTIEHIFAQEPLFDFPNFGFSSLEEYYNKIHRVGNLTLLERKYQSSVSNKNPSEKIRSNIYGRSIFRETNRIDAELKTTGHSFAESNIVKRTSELSQFCLERWRIN